MLDNTPVVSVKYKDTWFPRWGVGVCDKVTKTRAYFTFSVRGRVTYTKDHYKYLEAVS